VNVPVFQSWKDVGAEVNLIARRIDDSQSGVRE
jgi:hypothetical protein